MRKVSLSLIYVLLILVGIASTQNITNVAATPNANGATVTWDTDTPGSSQAFYGLTDQYTDSTTFDSNNTKTHSVSITGLNPCSDYHYSVQSKRGNRTVVASEDDVFTTLCLTLVGIAINPQGVVLPNGQTVQYTATGTYDDASTADITDSVAWTSSNVAVATISSQGVATGTGVGSATITATSGTLTATSTVTVSGTVTLSSIALTPATPTINVGGTQQLTATCTYSDASTQDCTSSVVFSSSNTAVATVCCHGLVTAKTVGTSNLSATLNSITAPNDVVTVAKATPAFAGLTPSQTIATGTASVVLSGILSAPGAIPVGGTVNISASTASTTATVASDGSFSATMVTSGLSAGAFTVTYSYTTTAQFAAASDTSTTLTVQGAVTLSSIAVTPANPSNVYGTQRQFTATGTYSDASTQDLTSVATFHSSNTGVATTGTGGLATTTGAGTTSITATYNGVTSPGDTLTVTKAAPAFSAIQGSQVIQAGTASVPVSGTLTSPTGPIPVGGIVTITASTATITATVAANGSFMATLNTSALVAGVYTITYSYSASTNFNAATNTATTLTVNAVTTGVALDQTTCPGNVCPFKDVSGNVSNTLTSGSISTGGTNRLITVWVATNVPTSGSLITGVTSTTTSGPTLTWARVKGQANSAAVDVWRAFAATAWTGTITVQLAAGSTRDASFTVAAFTGIDTSGTNGSGAIGATNGASITTGPLSVSLTTTRNGSWVWGVGADTSVSSARTLGSGQTMVHQLLDLTNPVTYWTQRQTSTTSLAGTTVTINDTAPTASQQSMAVVEIKAPGVNHSATLNWVDSGTDWVSFSVYRAGPYAAGHTCVLADTFTRVFSGITVKTQIDTSVNAGQVYCYTVVAVNASGQESVKSNVATAQIPTP